MYLKEFLEILKKGETERVEFKSRVTSDLGQEICALANAFGGHIFVGVDDEGHIAGCEVSTSKERISQHLTSIVPPIEVVFHTIDIDKQKVLVVEVPSTGGLCSIGGTAFIRVGTSKRPLSIQEIFIMGAENILFEMDKTPSGMTGLDEDLVEEFFERARSKIFNKMDYLKKLEVITPKGEVSITGVLFFHSLPQSLLPHSSIRLIHSDGRWKRYNGPIWKIIDELESDLKGQLLSYPIRVGFRRQDILEYPLSAIREGLVNAMTHRNYAIKSEVFLELGSDFLEIRNPGSFPPGTSPQNPVPIPRNPLIYELMFQAGYVERQGRGIDLIKSECEAHPFVDYEYLITPNQTRLRFLRTSKGLTEDQQRIVKELSHGAMSSSELGDRLNMSRATIVRRLSELMSFNIIKKKGSGPSTRYYIELSNV